MTSRGHRSPHEHLQKMAHPEASLPALNYQEVLDQLKQQFPRFPTHLTSQMNSAYYLFQKIRQGLQEHHKQAENFLQMMETCSQSLGFQLGKHQGNQDSQHPGSETLQPSGLQRPNFEDMATRSSDWPQQAPGEDKDTVHQLDTWPSWDPEPRFWQDVLMELLWRMFALTHDQGEHPRCMMTEQATDLPLSALGGPEPVCSSTCKEGWHLRPLEHPVHTTWALQASSGSQSTPAPTAGRSFVLNHLPNSHGQESQDPGPRHLKVEVLPKASLVFSSARPSSSSSEDTQKGSSGLGTIAGGVFSHKAQELAGKAHQFLKPICWDPEDFEDTWNRPDILPWQSKKLAIPHRVEKMRRLDHGEPVLATAISSFTRHAFTCGRGGVKVWSLVGQVAEATFPESYLRVQTQGAYLRTCLLMSNSTTLLTGGHNLAGVSLWDLTAPSLHVRAELPCTGLTCQALAASPEDSLAFASFTNGTVRIWDLRNQSVVRDLPGYLNGARSIAVKDQTIWTGGLDAYLRCWDLRTAGEPQEYQFESQIMSLSPSPQEEWVLVGTANGQQWLQPTLGGQKHMAGCKDGTILGLKFSPLGQWWVTVGTDNLVSIYSRCTGTTVVQVPESSSVMCCDVSASNRLIITGSRDHASVYQIMY
ncbi:transducin-like enhancer protein 6 isoform X2 [Sus scrofa]|uniref:transducin-like enhancer protein 6 isoform X2 n=1 Tax=Sus scrofa TaxID=9823 RepID=UPI000A2AF6FA|nr:transducin-like enhancer protein 6 isoform X2 [Sus scrofa]